MWLVSLDWASLKIILGNKLIWIFCKVCIYFQDTISIYFEYSIYWLNIQFILSNFNIKFSQIYNITWANNNFTFLCLMFEILTIKMESFLYIFKNLNWSYSLPPTLHLQGIKRLPVACKIMAYPLPFVQMSVCPSIRLTRCRSFFSGTNQNCFCLFSLLLLPKQFVAVVVVLVPCVVDRCQEKLIFRQIFKLSLIDLAEFTQFAWPMHWMEILMSPFPIFTCQHNNNNVIHSTYHKLSLCSL